MGFRAGLAVPLFLFVVSITCNLSLGQSETWNVLPTYRANSVPSINNGMIYNGAGGSRSMGYGGKLVSAASYSAGNGGRTFGGESASAGGGRIDRFMGYSRSSTGSGTYGGRPDGGMTFSKSAASAASYGAGNGSMGLGETRTSWGGGGAYVGAYNGVGGFNAATVGNGTKVFYSGANGNGFGGFDSGSSGFPRGADSNGGRGFKFAGSGIQGFDVDPGGNFTPGFGSVPKDNGFVAVQGNAPTTAVVRVSAGPDGDADSALPPVVVRNGDWKSGHGRPRKIKPTFLSGGFSLKKSLAYVINAFTSLYFKLSLPDSLKRVAKYSGLFKSTGFSLGSMYQAYFTLYNDISASHDEMSILEIGSLAFMEMVLSFLKFLKSTPFVCLMNIVGSYDYLSLMYSLLSLMGGDSLNVAQWATYMYSMLTKLHYVRNLF